MYIYTKCTKRYFFLKQKTYFNTYVLGKFYDLNANLCKKKKLKSTLDTRSSCTQDINKVYLVRLNYTYAYINAIRYTTSVFRTY